MYGIYNYIPKTNHVTTVYSVAAVLYLQFMLHVKLLAMLSMFCTVTSATNRKVAGSIPAGVSGIFH